MILHKYPRTRHLEGSRLQPGDHDLEAVPFADLAGRYVVVEEKLDGANAAVSFDASRALRLQSRGHYLSGGVREKYFDLFKTWAAAHTAALGRALGDRYILYGEWLYAKHTIFYDRLPHYFLEFDILDTVVGDFLSTERRRALLGDRPVASVPVLWSGQARTEAELVELIGPSRYKSEQWREVLEAGCRARGLDAERIGRESDPTDLMEGLYIKVEEEGRVIGRYKYIRASFLTRVLDSGSHWLTRPILPNQLAEGTDLFRAAP
jgi:hypothetical protein